MSKPKGKITNCPHTDKPHWAKGICLNCYAKQYYDQHKKDPIWKASTNLKRNEARNKKYWSDPEFREKYQAKCRITSKKWAKKKNNTDPNWNKNRQLEFRHKYPDKFNLTMARCYARKLSYENKGILLDFLAKERIKEKMVLKNADSRNL